jgi:rhodanese-related sulfurtransferase
MNRFGKQVLCWALATTLGSAAVGLARNPAFINVTASYASKTKETTSTGYRDVGPRAVYKSLVRFHHAVLLINVHIPYEGEIQGTDAFIPFNTIADALDALPADKDAEIVLYCMSGRMSEIAATTLVEHGYTNVRHVRGGMIAWRQAGLPLERQPLHKPLSR